MTMKKLVYVEIRKPNKNVNMMCDVEHFNKIKKKRSESMIEILSTISIYIIVVCVFVWMFLIMF